MAGRMSRNKGAGAERELSALLSKALGIDIKRKLGQARDSGDDIQIGEYRIEVKRRETLAIMQWCKQVEACCQADDVPIVAFRQNGQDWRVVMRLHDILPLLKNTISPEPFASSGFQTTTERKSLSDTE